jgi:hypothetical protein
MEPLSDKDIQGVIETFWRLDAGKAHLAEFLPIMDEGFYLRAVDSHGREVARFDGLAGLEDHQDGKMDMFDEEFLLESLDINRTGRSVVAYTAAVWTFRHRVPRAPTSSMCAADLAHEWYLRRHPERLSPVMTGHTCTHFEYRPGQAPPVPSDRQAVKESSASLHEDPSALMR